MSQQPQQPQQPQQEISIINLDQLVSMTSVEIAELTGKEHRNVLRDIRKMLEELNAGNAASLLI